VLWLDDCRSINVGLSTIQTNATRRMEWVYYSNKLAVQCDFREFDGRPISLGYTTIHWTFGLRAHTVKFCLWRSRFALHIVKQYFAECGLRNSEFEQRIICGTFLIKISANYTLFEFHIPQSAFHKIHGDLHRCVTVLLYMDHAFYGRGYGYA